MSQIQLVAFQIAFYDLLRALFWSKLIQVVLYMSASAVSKLHDHCGRARSHPSGVELGRTNHFVLFLRAARRAALVSRARARVPEEHEEPRGTKAAPPTGVVILTRERERKKERKKASHKNYIYEA